jgi:hypothetical protein
MLEEDEVFHVLRNNVSVRFWPCVPLHESVEKFRLAEAKRRKLARKSVVAESF